MSEGDVFKETAAVYDSMIEEYQSFGDLAVFGSMYDHILPGEKVLDIGIGTGLSSFRLARHGLDVYGIDISESMLEQCRRKGFAKELKLADIKNGPIPYPESYFDHILSAGVLHFFEDLDHIFKEANRALRTDGTFTFTIMSDRDGGPEDDTVERRMTRWGVEVFHQGREYIKEICKNNGLSQLSWMLVVGDIDPRDGRKNYYWIYVCRKRS